jgi:hypothetical protein
LEMPSNDLLDLAASLASGASYGPALNLKEALQDYNNVCARLKGEKLSSDDCTQWIEIRSELIAEISRLTNRLKQNHQ